MPFYRGRVLSRTTVFAADGQLQLLRTARFVIVDYTFPVFYALKAKFHYASWFEAGRRTSFEPASVTEFGYMTRKTTELHETVAWRNYNK